MRMTTKTADKTVKRTHFLCFILPFNKHSYPFCLRVKYYCLSIITPQKSHTFSNFEFEFNWIPGFLLCPGREVFFHCKGRLDPHARAYLEVTLTQS